MKVIGLRITALTFLGVLFGLGGTTLHYAEIYSYLSTDPSACVNCHIMRPQYDAWQKASHHSAATCADCHLPAAFPEKYLTKAENGWAHSKAFTMQNFHEPIFIKSKNMEILQNNCLRCHADLINMQSFIYTEGAARCVRCHDAVGHGEAAGLGGPMLSVGEELNGGMEER